MYTVGDKKFSKILEAIREADVLKTDVIEAETGLVRWTPGTISKKQFRRYNLQKAAYAAQLRMNANRED